MTPDITLGLAHWLYLAGVIAIIGIMAFRSNVVVPAVIATSLVVFALTGSPVTGVIGVFSASLTAAQELFSIFLVIAFMTALLYSLKAVKADVLMVKPFLYIMRGGTSSFIVLAVVTYIFSLFFWPTPAVPLVCAILLPAAIAAGLPPLVGAAVVAIAGQGMALSSDFIIGVAPSISGHAGGISDVDAIKNTGLILSWIVGGVAFALIYMFSRKSFKAPNNSLLMAWEATSAVTGGFATSSGNDNDNSGTNEQLTEHGDQETSDNSSQGEDHYSTRFAILTPLVFLIVLLILVLPTLFPNIPALRGGQAAGLVGGAGFLLMVAINWTRGGWRAMLDTCPADMTEGFVFAFRAMAAVIPIAGFFFLGTSEAAAKILGVSPDVAPSLLFDLVEAGQQLIPSSDIFITFGILIAGMITGIDGSGFSGLPLTGALSGSVGPVLGLDSATLAAIGQMGSVWTGGGTLIAWSSLIAVAGFSRVSVLDLVRKLALPVIAGLITMTVIATLFMM